VTQLCSIFHTLLLTVIKRFVVATVGSMLQWRRKIKWGY